jgi:glycerol kinase
MSLATGRGELVRAAYEGIACRVAEVVSAVDAEAGAPVPALRVDGGLTASAVLMQIVADLLGRPVEVSAEPEATLAGACALAARATGAWRDDARVRARARPGAVYRPALDEAARLARRARFERARGLVSAFET